MFGFFVNGEFKGFWSNSVNDQFLDLTCIKMGWSKYSVELVYYNGLTESELLLSEPSLEKVRVYFDEKKEKLKKEIIADKFFIKGLMLRPC